MICGISHVYLANRSESLSDTGQGADADKSGCGTDSDPIACCFLSGLCENEGSRATKDARLPSFCIVTPVYLLILAHESLRVTVRLNTGWPGLESVSAQKYPTRSNWKGCPMGASPSDGSR